MNALLYFSSHKYLVHTEEDNMYYCTKCTKSFKNRRQFKQHTSKLHKEISCNISNIEYMNLSYYATSYWAILHTEKFHTDLDLILSNITEQCIRKLSNISKNHLISKVGLGVSLLFLTILLAAITAAAPQETERFRTSK